MPKFDALDNVAHADLKVRFEFGDAFGNNVNHTVVFPTEFDALQREYPIFFRRAENGSFYAVALLGLDKDHNLFLSGGQWQARYVPAVQMRGPFALELRDGEKGAEAQDPIVRIDTQDARVNSDEGENIFKPHGGYTPFFEQILQALRRVHVGAQVSGDFYAQLQAFDLIEPITVEANYGDTLQYKITDMYTISRERLAKLNGEQLQTLNELGLLEHCFAVISSFANVSRLVDMKALSDA